MNHNHRGFTLTEIAIVIAILMLTAGILFPVSLRGMREMSLQYATQSFAGELMRARLLALNENAPIVVLVAPQKRSFQLASAVDRTCARGPERFLDHRVVFSQIPSREVIFHPWGTAAPAGSYTLSGAAGQMSVVVSITGRVRIARVTP
jgi:prepilin-type N-terminal cleavage/methylation domain-containing protein